jgi:alpha-tubulin suppressor-like RCC1 family protein
MSERYPGGLIRKTPPTITGPATSGLFAGEGGSASGVWTLADVLAGEKADIWPKPILPRKLYSWGYNSQGQLGDGTIVNRSSPVQVGSLTNWFQASSGFNHSASVKLDGTLWTWGNGFSGRLGDNSTNSRSSPIQVGVLTNWAQVAAGVTHTASIKTDGTIWTFGGNTHGQLGDNTAVDKSSPIQVGALTDWYQVSAGNSYFTAAVKTNKTLWTWGRNQYGQLGQGINILVSRSSPVQVGFLTNWSYVSCGYQTTGAVKTDGTLWTWGRAAFGSLGTGSPNVSQSSPVQVGALTDWAQVSIGQFFGSAIKTNGTLWTWGSNYYGELGDGTRVDKSSPVQIGALTNWSQVSCGFDHTAAVKTDGTLWSWGRGLNGRLGTGNTISRSSPVQVGSLTGWSQVSTSNLSNLAVLKG